MFISFSIRWISNKNYMHFWLFFSQSITIIWLLKKHILNNISFNNMHIHNFWQYVLWSAFFFLQCHSNYVNYSCSLWEDNIWIKDQLVHMYITTILNKSFESLKYIQEYLHDKQLNKLLFGLLCSRKSVYGNFIFDSLPNI